MKAEKTFYNDIPEIIKVPKELVHKKGEVIFIIEEQGINKKKPMLKDFYGSTPDFPERENQGEYELREEL